MSVTFASPPSQQLFSIPYNFVLYLTENPSTPELLEKLYQTCKFFYSKNPVLITPRLHCYEGGFSYSLDYDAIVKVNRNTKFWPTLISQIYSQFDKTKFYRFSVSRLLITGMTLSMSDFEMLIAENTVRDFFLLDAQITDATFDVILSKLPNLKQLEYHNPDETFSHETLSNLLSNERQKIQLKVCTLFICKISDNVTPQSFVKFVLLYAASGAEFILRFHLDDPDFKMKYVNELQNQTLNDRTISKIRTVGNIVIASCM